MQAARRGDTISSIASRIREAKEELINYFFKYRGRMEIVERKKKKREVSYCAPYGVRNAPGYVCAHARCKSSVCHVKTFLFIFFLYIFLSVEYE